MKTKNTTTPRLIKSICWSPSRLALLLISLVFTCFALSPTAQAAASQTDTSLGKDALKSITTGVNDTALGYQALKNNTTGGGNTATGSQALIGNTIGNNNTATGFGSLTTNTTGSENTASGFQALYSNTTGTENTATGYQSMFSNVDGSMNTAYGFQALYSNRSNLFENAAFGFQALFANTTGWGNVAIGAALRSNTDGNINIAIGGDALFSNTHGSRNIAMGINALLSNTTGGHNAAYGNATLQNIETGNFNLALGFNAGLLNSTGDNNIYLGNPGNDDESNTIRIGNEVATPPLADGSIQPAHTATFIAGIYGASTSDAASTTAVYVDMNGNLGTVASSQRFKRDIRPMDNGSEAILALKPVTFHYKSDTKGTPQFGLIAEEVSKVNPDLVVRDATGKVYTVRYEAVNAMLLNEFLKEHSTVQELKTTVAQQQKHIEALTAGLEKVSAELEASKPAPQVVNNP